MPKDLLLSLASNKPAYAVKTYSVLEEVMQGNQIQSRISNVSAGSAGKAEQKSGKSRKATGE
ncbi:MAG: hypothetical protein M1379_05745 [Firmicutes bacterium]|nr:hypothetical protein [Bacillota bacterium]